MSTWNGLTVQELPGGQIEQVRLQKVQEKVFVIMA